MPTHVLLIDPDINFMVGIKQALEQTGEYVVNVSANGVAGQDALAHTRHEVAVLDFDIPDMDVVELIVQLRRIQPDLAVIMSPSTPRHQDRVRYMDVQGVIQKPYAARTLIPYLHSVLARVQSEAENDDSPSEFVPPQMPAALVHLLHDQPGRQGDEPSPTALLDDIERRKLSDSERVSRETALLPEASFEETSERALDLSGLFDDMLADEDLAAMFSGEDQIEAGPVDMGEVFPDDDLVEDELVDMGDVFPGTGQLRVEPVDMSDVFPGTGQLEAMPGDMGEVFPDDDLVEDEPVDMGDVFLSEPLPGSKPGELDWDSLPSGTRQLRDLSELPDLPLGAWAEEADEEELPLPRYDPYGTRPLADAGPRPPSEPADLDALIESFDWGLDEGMVLPPYDPYGTHLLIQSSPPPDEYQDQVETRPLGESGDSVAPTKPLGKGTDRLGEQDQPDGAEALQEWEAIDDTRRLGGTDQLEEAEAETGLPVPPQDLEDARQFLDSGLVDEETGFGDVLDIVARTQRPPSSRAEENQAFQDLVDSMRLSSRGGTQPLDDLLSSIAADTTRDPTAWKAEAGAWSGALDYLLDSIRQKSPEQSLKENPAAELDNTTIRDVIDGLFDPSFEGVLAALAGEEIEDDYEEMTYALPSEGAESREPAISLPPTADEGVDDSPAWLRTYEAEGVERPPTLPEEGGEGLSLDEPPVTKEDSSSYPATAALSAVDQEDSLSWLLDQIEQQLPLAGEKRPQLKPLPSWGQTTLFPEEEEEEEEQRLRAMFEDAQSLPSPPPSPRPIEVQVGGAPSTDLDDLPDDFMFETFEGEPGPALEVDTHRSLERTEKRAAPPAKDRAEKRADRPSKARPKDQAAVARDLDALFEPDYSAPRQPAPRAEKLAPPESQALDLDEIFRPTQADEDVSDEELAVLLADLSGEVEETAEHDRAAHRLAYDDEEMPAGVGVPQAISDLLHAMPGPDEYAEAIELDDPYAEDQATRPTEVLVGADIYDEDSEARDDDFDYDQEELVEDDVRAAFYEGIEASAAEYAAPAPSIPVTEPEYEEAAQEDIQGADMGEEPVAFEEEPIRDIQADIAVEAIEPDDSHLIPVPVEAAARLLSGEDQPDIEDEEIARVAVRLTQFSLESMAQATMLVKGEWLLACAGDLPEPARTDLFRTVTAAWRGSPPESNSLIRYVRLGELGEFLLFSLRVDTDMALCMVFHAGTPVGLIRRQARRLRESLEFVPESPPEPEPEIEEEEPPAEVEAEPPETLPSRPTELKPPSGVYEAIQQSLGEEAPGERLPRAEGPYTGYTCLWLPYDPALELTGGFVDDLREWIRDIVHDQAWDLELLDIRSDYVLLTLHVPQKTLPDTVIGHLTEETTWRAVAHYPETVHETEPLWADGYYVVAPPRELTEREIARFTHYQRQAQFG